MYGRLNQLALPYYKKGRTGDVQHISWLVERLEEIIPSLDESKIDIDIIRALTILHDIGYANILASDNPFDLDNRTLHAKESAVLAKPLLDAVNFPKDKYDKVLYLIEHHDDWALGDAPTDMEWRVFTDLDFAWEASSKGFDIVRTFLDESPEQFVATIQRHYNEKQKKYPFSVQASHDLFLNDFAERKKEVQNRLIK